MKTVNLAVIVGALGYFVDIFDLFLFSTVRIPSLISLKVSQEKMFETGVLLLNSQAAGLLLGGVICGVLADKVGRKKVLFGSIFLYSAATLLNGWVDSVSAYACLRFLAGLGLAGELGTAISLVVESLPTHKRGIGTTLVTSFGLLGGIAASLVGEYLTWRTAYLLGGALGFLLLLLRFNLDESPLFERIKNTPVLKGDLRMLLGSSQRLKKFLACILVGVPVYFVSGILITFSPEIAKALEIDGEVVASRAVLWSYIGSVIGDFASGIISQNIKNRKRVIACYLVLCFAMILTYLSNVKGSLNSFYMICGLVGMMTGYWVVLLTLCAEQFGTNLRATVTTSIPNFVRGSVFLWVALLGSFKHSFGILNTAQGMALGVVLVSLLGLSILDETFSRDVSFLES